MPRHVCLTGTSGSLNRGDAAIQLAAILELLRRDPTLQITVLSPDPPTDKAVYTGAYVVRTVRLQPAQAALLLAAAAWNIPPAMLPRGVREELDILRQSDILIDLSGDGFTKTFGIKRLLSHAVPLVAARQLGLPCVLMGQTIGPFTRLRSFHRWLFDGARAITCRDPESILALRELDVQTPMHLTADVAFLLPPVPPESLLDVCPWVAALDRKRPLIAVTPSNLHNVRTGVSPERVNELLAVICERLAELSRAIILAVPAVYGPGDECNDRRAARKLAERIHKRCTVRHCDEMLGPRELQTLLGMCHAHVGLRMHGLIAAMSQGVPSLALSYAPKTGQLMRRMRCPDLYLDPATASNEDAVTAAERLWNSRNEIHERLKAALHSEILPAARANFDHMGK